MNLEEYHKKRVKIIDVDDKQWIGYVDLYCQKEDNEENEDSIIVKVDGISEGLTEFMESEIKSISVI